MRVLPGYGDFKRDLYVLGLRGTALRDVCLSRSAGGGAWSGVMETDWV